MSIGIVAGMGEVGKALTTVLSGVHDVFGLDINYHLLIPAPIDVLHICFPYGEGFEDSVKGYQKEYEPKYTIVHSTVPIGTCKKLKVFHSPVRGIHPHLAESMVTFVTYLAPRNMELVDYLEKAGMTVVSLANSDNSEAGKLWSLASYAVSIVLEKEIYQYCKNNGLDWNVVYKHFTQTYNDGYGDMGMGEYIRPVLEHMEGGIGGHCIMPGLDKLEGGSRLVRFLKNMNMGY